jgi:hypothetical protein
MEKDIRVGKGRKKLPRSGLVQRYRSGAGDRNRLTNRPKTAAVARRLQRVVRSSAASPPHVQKELSQPLTFLKPLSY